MSAADKAIDTMFPCKTEKALSESEGWRERFANADAQLDACVDTLEKTDAEIARLRAGIEALECADDFAASVCTADRPCPTCALKASIKEKP